MPPDARRGHNPLSSAGLCPPRMFSPPGKDLFPSCVSFFFARAKPLRRIPPKANPEWVLRNQASQLHEVFEAATEYRTSLGCEAPFASQTAQWAGGREDWADSRAGAVRGGAIASLRPQFAMRIRPALNAIIAANCVLRLALRKTPPRNCSGNRTHCR